MRKYILQPEKIRNWIAFSILFSISAFFSSVSSQGKSSIQLEDLLFYERIIIGFYAGGDERSVAIRDLETRCRLKDLGDGLSCANLAILYKNSGDLPRAYTASAIAYKKEPGNSYFRNLFQNMAMRSGNLRDMEKRMGRDGRTVVRYTRAIQECNEGQPGRALSDVMLLVENKHLTKEQFERGLFFECYREDLSLLENLKARAIPNPLNYTALLREEEDRLNDYKDIWDLDYFRKEVQGKLEESDVPEKELTKLWADCKKAILEGNAALAKSSYWEVKKILESEKKQGKKRKLVAESLELAIELTLTQDSRFAKKIDFLTSTSSQQQ